jgi:hypothetical protein
MTKTISEIKSSSAFQLAGRNIAAAAWWETWFQVAMPPTLNAVSIQFRHTNNDNNHH